MPIPPSLNFVTMEVGLHKFPLIFYISVHHLCHGVPSLSVSFYFSSLQSFFHFLLICFCFLPPGILFRFRLDYSSVFVTSSYNWNSFHPAQCSQLITQTGSCTVSLINTHTKGLRRTLFKNMRNKKTRIDPCLKKTINKLCSKGTKFTGPSFCDLVFYPSKE